MKTTVEISDALFAKVRERATAEGTTMRALIEEGLRRLLDDREKRTQFRLRKVSFAGEGLQPDLGTCSWSEIRGRVYEGRGE